MFRSARVKLTAWYLLIIMCVSIVFSAAIYRLLMVEVQRFEQMHRNRIERGFGGFMAPLPVNQELLDESRDRIISELLLLNGLIFVAAGGLGYILAGRTLRPIAVMVTEQNRFVSDASHELKTPLTSLKSAFEVFLRDKRPTVSDAQTLARESVLEVDKLQTLADSLLQLAQYKKPAADTEQEKLSVKDLLSEAMRSITPIAKQRQITIKKQIKDCTVCGNRKDLINVFLIVLDNAVKYSHDKGVVTVTSTVKKRVCVVTVTDKGIGIETKDMPRIFDRFYRADGARTRAHSGGYGLGLPIARQIVQAHRGALTLKSAPRTGTTATITLPL